MAFFSLSRRCTSASVYVQLAALASRSCTSLAVRREICGGGGGGEACEGGGEHQVTHGAAGGAAALAVRRMHASDRCTRLLPPAQRLLPALKLALIKARVGHLAGQRQRQPAGAGRVRRQCAARHAARGAKSGRRACMPGCPACRRAPEAHQRHGVAALAAAALHQQPLAGLLAAGAKGVGALPRHAAVPAAQRSAARAWLISSMCWERRWRGRRRCTPAGTPSAGREAGQPFTALPHL